ncbi:MAG TPA: hypothetical protein VKA95_03510 [Nitrososphaeraceae archaeon]|nr:hypothetical protein [Nitrososphaeraceae archaeon]
MEESSLIMPMFAVVSADEADDNFWIVSFDSSGLLYTKVPNCV